MDFWKKNFDFLKKWQSMERSGPIKIRKTEISRSLMVKTFISFFYRILRQKIRLKKLAKKKFWLTPTQFFDVKGQNTGSHNVHLLEKPIIDRIKPQGVLESPKIGGNFDRGVFSISVPVSRNLSPK